MYGDLEQLDDGRWQLRFTRALAHPPEKVWRASLGGDADARDEMNGWRDVHEHYIESFGPEAATIGPPEGI